MAKKQILRRLLRLRELEEELSRAALEAAARERDRVGGELKLAQDRKARGREVFLASVGDADSAGRIGGLVEAELAMKQQGRIQPRLKAAEGEVARQRQEFLLRRTGRLQVETLAENARRLEEAETGRRAQQMLDDWYGRRNRTGEAGLPDSRNRKPLTQEGKSIGLSGAESANKHAGSEKGLAGRKPESTVKRG